MTGTCDRTQNTVSIIAPDQQLVELFSYHVLLANVLMASYFRKILFSMKSIFQFALYFLSSCLACERLFLLGYDSKASGVHLLITTEAVLQCQIKV